MDAITIPSPSAFLNSPVTQPSAAPPPIRPAKTAPKRPPTTAKASAGAVVNGAGITKPKQSKSRNGCITCKTKRLKCDETKPTCQQCHKRNVVCGGYKKDFKWRPFEETVLSTKTVPKLKRGGSDWYPPPTGDKISFTASSPSLSDASGSTPGNDPLTFQNSSFGLQDGHPSQPPSFSQTYVSQSTFSQSRRHAPTLSQMPISPRPLSHPPVSDTPYTSAPYVRPHDLPYIPQIDPQMMAGQNYRNDTATDPRQAMNDNQFNDRNINTGGPTSAGYSPGQSPRLIDLLSPGSYMGPNPEFPDFRPQQSPIPYQPSGYTPPPMLMDEDYDDDVEEIVRESEPRAEPWAMRMSSPTPSSSSSSSDGSANVLYPQPRFKTSSPEMLMLRFDRQTCGILSVKDGPTENPWRTLIWPLARDSPALYHAISSMTAFHSSQENREMRVEGVDHMRRSVKALAMGLENMRVDTALATTLVLAFSESWDQHISTGIQHLRGAKALVNQALIRHQQNSMSAEEITRLRFLFNTWKYMDVIARLTSIDEEGLDDFEELLTPLLGPADHLNEVDPLMGCASSLFPLIGRAARLVQQVRKTESNSFKLISQAIEVKTLIEQWEVPHFFEPPEDPTSDVQHSLQTAEAYRWATLLYLHQAVPEIPSQTAAQLAKKVLVLLATVPLSSRAIIVQIYPLLAASCEAVSEDDRRWVEERWTAMQRRLMIGNIDRCMEVIKEVWDRRDNFELEKRLREERRSNTRLGGMVPPTPGAKRKWGGEEYFDDLYSFLDSEANGTKRQAGVGDMGMPKPVKAAPRKRSIDNLENIEQEKTVRGSLHWVGVMRDWNWEVLLG